MSSKPLVSIIIIVGVLLMISAVCPTQAGQAPSEIYISPQTQNVSPGETFNISVYCDPTEPIEGFEFDLDFNATLLQVNSVAEGDIFDGYDTWFNNGTIDNTNGYIDNVYNLITEVGNVSDSGTLAIISFTAGSINGTSVLHLNDTGVSNATEYVSIIIQNGSVSVGDTSQSNNSSLPKTNSDDENETPGLGLLAFLMALTILFLIEVKRQRV